MADVIYCSVNGRVVTLCDTPDVQPEHMYQKDQTVMITGLRQHQLYWEDAEAYTPLKSSMEQDFKKLYDSGFRKFLVCGKPGIEMLAAEVVCDMKSHYDMVASMHVPYNGFEYYLKAEEIFGQAYYWKLQNRLDEVHVITRQVDPGSTGVQRMKAVTRCLTKAIDHSSRLVVYSSKGKDDSYIKNAVTQAKESGIPIERHNL